MPTYEYQCQACGHEMEEFQSITAAPLKKCPKCKKPKLKRLIGIGAGVIFKGSGFYETDYRSDSYKKQAKSEADAAKPKKDDSKASGDSKKSDKASAKSDTSKTPAKSRSKGTGSGSSKT